MIFSNLFNLFLGAITVTEFVQIIVFSLLAVMIAMCVHEFCHSITAYLLGDKTSYYQGRMTLNPFAHMDVRGIIFLLFFGIGYAKPVQVNSSRFKKPRLGMILTAAAGPLSNFLTAFILTFFYYRCFLRMIANPESVFYDNLLFLLQMIILYNILLGLFNLIPIPPLDGSKIIGELLPFEARRKFYSIERYSLYIWIGLIVLLNRTDFLSMLAMRVLKWFLTFWCA